MSKGHNGAENTKETHVKDTHAKEAHPKEAHAKEGHAKEGHAKEAHTGDAKKPAEHKKTDTPSSSSSKGKGHTPMPGGCLSWGCKIQASRFNFCDEHYDHFKFGLIKKTGEPVPDYEKKIEHFLAHKAKKSAQRVA